MTIADAMGFRAFAGPNRAACMTTVTLSIGYLFQVAYFAPKRFENHESLKRNKRRKKKSCSQRPPRLCERPQGGGTAPFEKP